MNLVDLVVVDLVKRFLTSLWSRNLASMVSIIGSLQFDEKSFDSSTVELDVT